MKKKDINIYIIKYLIEHGTDINNESFLYACSSGNEVIVKYLFEHGVNNVITPLCIALLHQMETQKLH